MGDPLTIQRRACETIWILLTALLGRISPCLANDWKTLTSPDPICLTSPGTRQNSRVCNTAIPPFADRTPPSVTIMAPAGGATVSGTVSVLAIASDDIGVAGVQFKVDGSTLGAEVSAAPYAIIWDTTFATNGSHVLTATTPDASDNSATASVTVTVSNPQSIVLFSDAFNVPDRLITNEHAHWNPGDVARARSSDWDTTSGSLFVDHGAAWTGIPNSVVPDGTSSNGNGSAVFRLTTKRADFGNVRVSFSLLNQGLSSTRKTPPVDWDGVHIFLRYQSQESLYYATINRRDGKVVIKKKVPGGPSNGGTYYDLCAPSIHTVPYGQWQQVKASVSNNQDGSVSIALFSGGIRLVSATDRGAGGAPPITQPGKVGIRGDNANFKFDDFVVTQIVPSKGIAPPAAERTSSGLRPRGSR